MFVDNNLPIVAFTLSKRGWSYFPNHWKQILWEPAEMAEIQVVLERG